MTYLLQIEDSRCLLHLTVRISRQALTNQIGIEQCLVHLLDRIIFKIADDAEQFGSLAGGAEEAFRGEGQPLSICRAKQSCEQFAGRNVPNPDGAVLSACERASAVRREGDRENPAGMPLE